MNHNDEMAKQAEEALKVAIVWNAMTTDQLTKWDLNLITEKDHKVRY